MKGWRVQWREFRANLKTPVAGDIQWEDGHDQESARAKAAALLQTDVCWVWVENLDAPHKGNSSEKPKERTKK